MLSPKCNLQFKHYGNETDYPFELSNNTFTAIIESMKERRQLIPASCFKRSWLAIEPNNVKAPYRSAEWVDWLLYSVPTPILSQFDDIDVIYGFPNLVRGV